MRLAALVPLLSFTKWVHHFTRVITYHHSLSDEAEGIACVTFILVIQFLFSHLPLQTPKPLRPGVEPHQHHHNSHPSNNHVDRHETHHKGRIRLRHYCCALANTIRTVQEYGDLQKTPIEGVKIQLASESDMHQWNVYIDGPKGSAYEVRLAPSLPSLREPLHTLPFPSPPNPRLNFPTDLLLARKREAYSTSTSPSPQTTPSNRPPSPSKQKSTTPTSPTTTRAPCAWACSGPTNGSPRRRSSACSRLPAAC